MGANPLSSGSTSNLLSNASAEQGLQGWTVTKDYLESLSDGQCGGIAPYSGTRYFAVGGICNTADYAEVYQQVHLPQRLHNKIDASGVTVKFGGMMSTWSGSDVPAIKLVFRDDSKSVISESNTLTSNATAWTATNSGNVSVPAQTRHIDMVLSGTRIVGEDSDCFFDDLFMRLSAGTEGDACTPSDLCDEWPEVCVTDPYNSKLSLDLGALGRGHHQLTVKATDMAGNTDENDFYLKVVDLNDELATWTTWLQGYVNAGDNNLPVLTALAGIQRAKSLFLNAPTQAMLQVKDVWSAVKDAFDNYGVDTYIMSAALPKGLFNESRRIAEAHYDANQTPWSLYDKGGFNLPCTTDTECFSSGESVLPGACVKPHPSAGKGICKISTCTQDSDCSWTYGDRCIIPHGASEGTCAVKYAIAESPYYQTEGYTMIPARYLSGAFAQNKAAYDQLSSNTTLAMTTVMEKSIGTLNRLAPLYENRIYADLYGQSTLVVRDYSDLPISYGYSCSADADCAALPGGFCEIIGNNEQGTCKRQEGSFGNAQRGSLSFGGDMGAQLRVL